MKHALDDIDTAVFIVTYGSELCTSMLEMLRAPGIMKPRPRANFEAAWQVFETEYATKGGPFGALMHPWVHTRGPMVAMGDPGEVRTITQILCEKARAVTKRDMTPLYVDPKFESAARTFAAEFSHTEGHA